MKKLILTSTLLFTTILSTYALADLPVCSPGERSWATNSRFHSLQIASRGGNTVAVFLDLETIKIDKKNKIIKAWTIVESSEKGRAMFTKAVDGFSNYGYIKMLRTIDYANMRFKSRPVSYTNCDGSTIVTDPDDGIWRELVPESLDELVTKEIMEKYNLK